MAENQPYWGRTPYASLGHLRGTPFLTDNRIALGSATTDEELGLTLLMAVSDWVDEYCSRHFHPRTMTLYFDGDATGRLLTPDLISVTTLKEDADKDLAYELTWAATDYMLTPYNAQPTKRWGKPYTSMLTSPNGKYKTFPQGLKNLEIAGIWGYRDDVEDISASYDLTADPGTTTENIVITSGSDRVVEGNTVRVENEQMLVINVTTGTPNTLFVRRGMNGTTAAAHAIGTRVKLQCVPQPIAIATTIQVCRLWTRGPAFEPFYVSPELDPDVKALLDPYRRIPV
jgi:hypothetical protein